MPNASLCAITQGPGGPLAVVYGPAGITEVVTDVRSLDEASRRVGRDLTQAPLPDGVARALGTGDATALRFDLSSLTSFQRRVLEETVRIPAGQVMSYGELAVRVGHPGAARAVGSAMRANPIPVLIPCHRVVRSDGSIGNYSGGGPGRKRFLLAQEAASSLVA